MSSSQLTNSHLFGGSTTNQAARELENGARLVGIAKGAGMIEPNMATMLCFLMTDAKLESRDEMQEVLSEAVSESFNAISVDGDESTSDAWWIHCLGH